MHHVVNQTSSGVTIVKVGGNRHDSSHLSHTPFTTPISTIPPISSLKNAPNGIRESRSRHNLTAHSEARSMSQLGSLQAINRSIGRLPSSMSTLCKFSVMKRKM